MSPLWWFAAIVAAPVAVFLVVVGLVLIAILAEDRRIDRDYDGD